MEQVARCNILCDNCYKRNIKDGAKWVLYSYRRSLTLKNGRGGISIFDHEPEIWPFKGAQGTILVAYPLNSASRAQGLRFALPPQRGPLRERFAPWPCGNLNIRS